MSRTSRITIGGVSIQIAGKDREVPGYLPPSYQPFMSSRKPDIALRLRRGLPDFSLGEKTFDCPPMWAVCRRNGTLAIRIYENPIFSGLERTLVFSHGDRADLYFTASSPLNTNPFDGPALELLMAHHLAQGGGAIIHACGIAVDGRGFLFVGQSGAGKSTLARIWDEETGVDILSDDRIILRKKGRQFWIYGTPWHGDGGFASPQSVRLEKIFFLKHSNKNSIGPVDGIARVSRLIACSFPTHWDPQGMAFTLDMFTDLAATVPFYDLAFTPDRRALEAIEQAA
jgi:hypothetical protein